MYSSWKNKNVNDLNYGYLCTSSWFLFTWFSQKKKTQQHKKKQKTEQTLNQEYKRNPVFKVDISTP